MPTANIAAIPANVPVANPPVTTAANATPGKLASGLPLFAQMVAQKMATPNSRQTCDPGAAKVPTGASSIAPVNSAANPSQKKAARASTNSSSSMQGSALLNQLSPVPGPILPPSIGMAISNPEVTTPANSTCSVWTVTDGPGAASAPDSLATPDNPNTPAATGATSAPVDQNASAAGNSPAITTAGNNPPPMASTLEGEIGAAPLPLPAALETSPAAQNVALDQTGIVARDAKALASLNQSNWASNTAIPATTPAVQDVAANQTPAVAPDPNAPALQSQVVPAGKTPSTPPGTSNVKAATAQSANNSVATIHPQSPNVEDVLRQVAAVTGKTNAPAAEVNLRPAKDPLSGPVKGSSVSPADVAKTDPQPDPSRSSAVGSHQNALEETKLPKGNGAGGGSSADQQEPGSPAAPASDAKGTTTAASVNFSDNLHLAQQNVPDPSSNLQGSAVAATTISFAKDAGHAQAPAAPDPSRSDGAGNSAPDKPDLDASASRLINSAQLGGTDAHSEMHIAMQADKLGAIELHARITGEQVGAAITVEKREAHAALAVELPSLQQALSEKNLHVQNVLLIQGAPDSTAEGAGDHGQQHSRSQPGTAYRQQQEANVLGPAIAAAESSGIFDDRGRLSVHA